MQPKAAFRIGGMPGTRPCFAGSWVGLSPAGGEAPQEGGVLAGGYEPGDFLRSLLCSFVLSVLRVFLWITFVFPYIFQIFIQHQL